MKQDNFSIGHTQNLTLAQPSTLTTSLPPETAPMADNFDIEEYLEEQVTKPSDAVQEDEKKSR